MRVLNNLSGKTLFIMNQLTTPEYFDADFYATLIETIQDGVIVVHQGAIILANQGFVELIGTDKERIIGISILEKVAPEYQELVDQRYQSRLSGENPPNEYEIDVMHEQGHRLKVNIKVKTFTGRDGQVYEVCSLRDITEQVNLVTQLKASEREFKQIIHNLPGIYYRTDSQGHLIKASPYALKILGFTPEESLGKPLTFFYANPEERTETLEKILSNKGAPVAIETLMRCKDGSTMWVSTSAYARFDSEDNFLGVEGVSLNITEQKNLESELRDKAINDPLTRLKNRFGFMESLEKALQRAEARSSQVSLVYIDLDNFKEVNDKFGHSQGDIYLQEFAKRLNESFRASDVVGRLGGDEFVVLLGDDTLNESLKDLLWRLKDNMQRFYEIKSELLEFEYSYGIANYPENGGTAQELLDFADQQMYQAKKNG